MDKKKVTIVSLLVVILVLGFFGWQLRRGAEEDATSIFSPDATVNPFEESVNPYKNIKTNPFE